MQLIFYINIHINFNILLTRALYPDVAAGQRQSKGVDSPTFLSETVTGQRFHQKSNQFIK